MALATLEEINVQLPDDKVEVKDAEYEDFQLDAERVVRGTLAGVVDREVLATWDEPDHTPGLIRAIVARLVAAFAYRRLYSEDSLEDPTFAQNKYNEAMSFLNGIVTGTMQLEEITTTAEGHYGPNDYFPNNSTPGPYFQRGQNL